MEEKNMSIREALQVTVQLIEEISVPVSMADRIARPLCQAVANIRAVIDAIPEAAEDEPKEGDADV
jgi:hypothetical protein